MLDQIAELVENIENADRSRARAAYDDTMAIARNGLSVFGDLIPHDPGRLRNRTFEYAYAAQDLAYRFFLHHGESLAPDAITPERYDNLPTFGRSRSLPSAEEWKEDILDHLRRHYPHTLPPEMRDGPARE